MRNPLLVLALVGLSACGHPVSPTAPESMAGHAQSLEGLAATRLAPAYVVQIWEPIGATCRATETPALWNCTFALRVHNDVNLAWYQSAVPNVTWEAACATDVHGSLTYLDAPSVSTNWSLPADLVLRLGDPPVSVTIEQRLPTGQFPRSVFAHPQWTNAPCL